MTPESADGLDVARQTINNHFDKIARLYEQGAGMERIGQYVKGWWQWVNAGVRVIVQAVNELWEQKWDDLHQGIITCCEWSHSAVCPDTAGARTITVRSRQFLRIRGGGCQHSQQRRPYQGPMR